MMENRSETGIKEMSGMEQKPNPMVVPLVNGIDGQTIFTERIWLYALPGGVLLSILFGALGSALASGAITISGLGQWSSAGAGVGGFTGGGIGLAIGGLIGAVCGLYQIPKRQRPKEG